MSEPVFVDIVDDLLNLCYAEPKDTVKIAECTEKLKSFTSILTTTKYEYDLFGYLKNPWYCVEKIIKNKDLMHCVSVFEILCKLKFFGDEKVRSSISLIMGNTSSHYHYPEISLENTGAADMERIFNTEY